MRARRTIAATLVCCLSLESCSSLREIPRGQLADLPEQRDVTVDTRTGLHYVFDSARFGPDSLWGFVRSDSGGAIEELSTTALPLESVTRVSSRQTDWYRTGLVAIGVIGAGIAFAVAQKPSSNSGGDGGTVKPPPTLAGARRR